MKLSPVWISAEVQARIKTLPIPLIKKEADYVRECDIIKIKKRQDPFDANSETYDIKIATFENSQPEELLALMKNLKSAVDGTGTTLASGRINYLRTLLHGESLLEFDGLV